MRHFVRGLWILLIVGAVVGCGRKASETDPAAPATTNNQPAIEVNPVASDTTNSVPTIVNPSELSVLETSILLGSIAVTDPDGDATTVSLGGADGDAFVLVDGSLSFVNGPDYEVPGDANADNEYVVIVSASDGVDTATVTLTISVTDGYEARVVDGPVAEALVFVDLNCNAIKDNDEPISTTDDSGYFIAEKAAPAADCNPKIISKGGIDTITGQALANLVLVAELPADGTKEIAVSPITTILAAAETAAEKQQVLDTLGLAGSTPEQILTTDSWAGAESNNEIAIAIQRVNQQVATILQAAVTIADDGNALTDDAAGSTTAAAIALVGLVQAANQKNPSGSVQARLDLADPSIAVGVITATVTAAGRDAVPGEVLTAIGQLISNINTAAADVSVNPTSVTANAIAASSQNAIGGAVAAVISGETSVEDFNALTEASSLFENVDTAGQSDFDGDGIADILDPDDDNDGVTDTQDAFPKDALEVVDTDLDGIGDNKDGDDDGDGVLDRVDAFPLVMIGDLLDTDNDGAPNDCDSACVALGMTDDPDDDGDGVIDTEDAFPLIAIGQFVDTDSDGAPDDCAASCSSIGLSADTDDDGDGVLDQDDAFPLIALGELLDSDGDGAPDTCPRACLALGMTADLDDDNDGIADQQDGFPLISIGALTDTDGDGYPDTCDAACLALDLVADLDDDNDGIVDTDDAFSLISIGSLLDTDNDGAPDVCNAACLALGMTADLDDDNDGVTDLLDPEPANGAVYQLTSGMGGGYKLPTSLTVLKTQE